MGIYELINHSSLPGQVSPAGSRDESPETTVADNYSYMNTQMHLQTHTNFGFVPQRVSAEDSVDDYTSNTASMMNKTQDIGKFMKRNLMLNKTMTQMMGKRRGESDSTKQMGAAGGTGVYRERTGESILTDNDESVSVMLPINQITTTHKGYHAIRDYANSSNIGHLKKMAQTHVRQYSSDSI